MKKSISLVVLALAIFLAGMFISCDSAEEPDYVTVVKLSGSAYERGLAHGQQLKSTIRSLYTRLLTTSIVPYLNREQISIAPVLPVYNRPEYRGGDFSRLMTLESGKDIWKKYISKSYKDEMRGIAEGAEMELDDIIVLNTFFDTMMGFRSIVAFIMNIQEPYIARYEFVGDLAEDGLDNNGNGKIDEKKEESEVEYRPLPHASMLEVPTDTKLRIVFADPNLPGFGCVDPRNVEPIGSMEMDSACTDAACLEESKMACIEPRVSGDCLDLINCVESMDPKCVDPDSVRILYGFNGQTVQYTSESPELEINLLDLPEGETDDSLTENGEEYPHAKHCQGELEVIFSPPGGFEPASAISLMIQVKDLSPIYSPEPFHNRSMRDERIVFTTKGFAKKNGFGKELFEVANRGEKDGITQAPSLAFALRGSATKDGDPIMAHHYALLDNDMLHEHSAVFMIEPEEGEGVPHVYLGYAGMVWGFSGMNKEGLGVGFTNSDSLDNPLVGAAIAAIFDNLAELAANRDLVGLSAALAETTLDADGLPIGLLVRDLLMKGKNVEQGLKMINAAKQTYGWNLMLSDAEGNIAVAEVDAGTETTGEIDLSKLEDRDGFLFYTPDNDVEGNLDANGKAWASVKQDDIRMGSHFQKNTEDMASARFSVMGTFTPKRQRDWTGFYFRSLRAFNILGDEIESKYGTIDKDGAIEILRNSDLVDTRDSMSACIMENAKNKIHWAMGKVPTTDAEFIEIDLNSAFEEGGAQ